MSDYKTLLVDVETNGIVSVALNRPDKRNALSAEMIAELTDVAQGIGAAPSTRAIVLSGRGKVFCAGGDLEWMQMQINATAANRRRDARKLAEMLQALNTMPAPLIGRIHGGAFGGGVGLACVCDIALAAADTRFGLTETRLGLIPATIGPYVVARLGEGPARRILMSSRRFEAEEAVSLGLVARVFSEDALDPAIAAETAPYLEVSPEAVSRAKAMARSLGPRIDDAVIDASIDMLAEVWETDDAREGIAAFLEKRAPAWAKRS